MPATADFKAIQQHFYVDDAVARYDKLSGGVTGELANYILEAIEPGELEGRVILDNAAGTGIVTRKLLERPEKMTIEAADISDVMTNHLKRNIKPTNGSILNVRTEDAMNLTYPDDYFDYTITLAGLQLFPDVDKAWRQLYRITKPNGKCAVTTWQKVEHKDIFLRVIKKLRGPDATFDNDAGVFAPQRQVLEKSEYLTVAMEKVGFKDCKVEIHTVHISYPGEEGIEYAMEALPGFYNGMMNFREGEKERWMELWRDELLGGYVVDGGIKVAMTGNIGWGTK